jgi:pimeloyl-ACP methyl ester carboxylesterase
MAPNPYYQGPPPDEVGLCPVEGNNYELHYEVRGKGKDSKLLLIMGAFGTCRQLESLADALAGNFEVVIYDHRGVGRSVLRRPIRSIHTR